MNNSYFYLVNSPARAIAGECSDTIAKKACTHHISWESSAAPLCDAPAGPAPVAGPGAKQRGHQGTRQYSMQMTTKVGGSRKLAKACKCDAKPVLRC